MARKTHTEAQARYDKVNRRVYGFRLHNEIDGDIIAKLASVDSMQGYIKQLIREDITRTCPGSIPVSAPDTIPVKLSRSVQESLEEQAKNQGISVPDIITAIVSEAAIRYEMHK